MNKKASNNNVTSTQILRDRVAAMFVAIGLCTAAACDGEEGLSDDGEPHGDAGELEDGETASDDEILQSDAIPQAELIAEIIHPTDGYQYEFNYLPESDSIGFLMRVDTQGAEGRPVPVPEARADLHPLDLYLEITSDETPVPTKLAKFAIESKSYSAANPRATTEDIVEADVFERSDVYTNKIKTKVWDCDASGGADLFEDWCDDHGVDENDGEQWRYCKENLTSSSHEYDRSWKITSKGMVAACWGPVETRHKYFHTVRFIAEANHNQLLISWHWQSGAFATRRVGFVPRSNGGKTTKYRHAADFWPN